MEGSWGGCGGGGCTVSPPGSMTIFIANTNPKFDSGFNKSQMDSGRITVNVYLHV